MAAGCDATIETPPSLRGTYTLWGALDPTSDTQAVRVVAVTDTLLAQSPAPLPVTVTSTDLATGTSTVWRDSLVTFRDGSVGHVYGARLRPDYGSRHRLVVRRRDDGREVTVTTTVPPRVEPVALPINVAGGIRATALWPGAEQLNRVRATSLIQIGAIPLNETPFQVCDTLSITVRITDRVGTSGPTDAGWAVALNLRSAYGPLLDLMPIPDPDGLLRIGLRRITLRGEVTTPEWRFPGGVADFEALAAAEVFDNVEGGFGFVGSAYRSAVVIRPAYRDLPQTNFVDTASQCRRPLLTP